VLIAGVGVVLAVGIAFGMAALASRGSVEVRLGSDTFVAGRAEDLAEAVGEDGPIPFADTAGGERDIVLQHLADDPEEGWVAFAARPPEVSRACTVQWDADDEVFRLLDAEGGVSGECDGTEFPPDGTGLPAYPVTVNDDGRLDIDLNAAERATSTTR
jgi:hypothetical protein